jgi:hypothetical protein
MITRLWEEHTKPMAADKMFMAAGHREDVVWE